MVIFDRPNKLFRFKVDLCEWLKKKMNVSENLSKSLTSKSSPERKFRRGKKLEANNFSMKKFHYIYPKNLKLYDVIFENLIFEPFQFSRVN